MYGFEDQLTQIVAVLAGFGYRVWSSHFGTIPVDPGRSNLQNCLEAVARCDVFLGIIRPHYGSGRIGERSIVHEEMLAAVTQQKPRWFLVHHDVAVARQLLKPLMFTKGGKRKRFRLPKTAVLDDIRVIDLYNDVIQNERPPEQRVGHWAQEYFRLDDILGYLQSQFSDLAQVMRIRKEMVK
ncbi:MAG: DUF4062 domain-containing protein [Candidatus Eisenbacteria bacterium]|nr:DUF4062 domain-containing protein [Candidatus Eisenbacteria bacterium]